MEIDPGPALWNTRKMVTIVESVYFPFKIDHTISPPLSAAANKNKMQKEISSNIRQMTDLFFCFCSFFLLPKGFNEWFSIQYSVAHELDVNALQQQFNWMNECTSHCFDKNAFAIAIVLCCASMLLFIFRLMFSFLFAIRTLSFDIKVSSFNSNGIEFSFSIELKSNNRPTLGGRSRGVSCLSAHCHMLAEEIDE